MGYVPAVSASERTTTPVPPGLGLRHGRREASGTDIGAAAASRAVFARISGYAWGAIGATVAFIALTCWWLTQDRSIPIYDAGTHLGVALTFHQMLVAGNYLGPFNYESVYPPFATMIGALAAFVGGVNVAAPIIGENLVFVSLLTLGCYQTGRLLFGPKAGMLAAIFVLGSDLLTAQFHVFMLDAPEAALVAVSVWLLLACDDFKRVDVSVAAGVAAGIGLLTKVQYPGFVAGIVAMALVRGGWRNWRGLAAFAVAAAVVGGPWYLDHLNQFAAFKQISTENPIVIPGDIPPLASLANFAWYFWNILNSQLLVPLYALLVGGTVWLAVTLFRRRRTALTAKLSDRPPVAEQAVVQAGVREDERTLGARLELFAGAFVGWLYVTVTPSHDIRYAIPLLPYLAVIATAWIVYLPRTWARLAIAVLAAGVIANTLGTTFGVGNTVKLDLAHPLPAGEEAADTVTLYSTSGFLVAGPSRDGDVPGMLEALRREGVNTVVLNLEQTAQPDFSVEGLRTLALIANLNAPITERPEFARAANVATLVHEPVTGQAPSPCTRLSDGTGVWVVRFDPSVSKLALYCPTRDPRYYDAGGIA